MMEKVKDEDQNVYKHATSTPEMPFTSLLNDFKFSHSGEYQESEFSCSKE